MLVELLPLPAAAQGVGQVMMEKPPAVAGVGFPSGHASHLNPRFLAQDAVGAGAFNFSTGVNLYKSLKPFLSIAISGSTAR
jgi:hypothetical protein